MSVIASLRYCPSVIVSPVNAATVMLLSSYTKRSLYRLNSEGAILVSLLNFNFRAGKRLPVILVLHSAENISNEPLPTIFSQAICSCFSLFASICLGLNCPVLPSFLVFIVFMSGFALAKLCTSGVAPTCPTSSSQQRVYHLGNSKH